MRLEHEKLQQRRLWIRCGFEGLIFVKIDVVVFTAEGRGNGPSHTVAMRWLREHTPTLGVRLE